MNHDAYNGDKKRDRDQIEMEEKMTLKYNKLLEPVKINNVVLRNRLICTASNPHFIQATEKWPTEALISHYANKAKAANSGRSFFSGTAMRIPAIPSTEIFIISTPRLLSQRKQCLHCLKEFIDIRYDPKQYNQQPRKACKKCMFFPSAVF